MRITFSVHKKVFDLCWPLSDFAVSLRVLTKMATSALLSVLIFGALFALKCEFSSAHEPAGADSSSNAALILYHILMGDMYELKYENRIMEEKIDMLEGTSDEGKIMSDKIETLEEKLESAELEIKDQASKIESLEENRESQETSAIEQTEKIDMIDEKLESLETFAKGTLLYSLYLPHSVLKFLIISSKMLY